jgi:hypothetical protein
MVVGYGAITLRLPENHSLKGKRKAVKAVIGRIRSNFNVSAAEIAANEMHQRAVIGVALTGNAQTLVNSKLDRIVNLVESMGVGEVLDAEMEVMSVSLPSGRMDWDEDLSQWIRDMEKGPLTGQDE